MRPIPRPTKETITKASIRGLEVIAPIKEPIQVTEEVTILPASARIAARVPAAGAEVKHTTFQTYSQERYIQAIWIKSRMIRIVRIAKAKPMK
jgi:hypothetical protein